MIYAPGDNGWLDVVRGFKDSAVRLETRAMYESDVEAGLFTDDFDPDHPGPPPGPNEWSEMIAEKVGGGAVVQRIRVFDPDHESETVARYQKWIRWYSQKNVDAGERHMYMTRNHWAYTIDATGLQVPDQDFWLLDLSTLVAFTFDDDGNQTVEVTKDAHRVRQAMAVWMHLVSAAERHHVA